MRTDKTMLKKSEHCTVIKFLTKQGKSQKIIHEEMVAIYQDSAPSLSIVQKWSSEFKRGRESTEDDPRSGGLVTATTKENMTHLSVGTIFTVFHDHLNLSKVCARWVPRMLMVPKKQVRVECCREFLELCGEDPLSTFDRIVTGDETWVHHYDPERISLIKYMKKGETINAASYATTLHNLREAIEEKRWGKLTAGVLLLHDNAPVHTARVSKAAVRDCGFEEINHPPYSPDLAPSDYYLFSNLKKDLRGKRFSDDEELKAAINAHFLDKEEGYFLHGIEKLISRCNKCIEVMGDYTEK
uniref:Mos1 transposase HTH domain-containing protein n=1 Tax=Varanus komodoensis TaxID=61221 RepID=A0A8D2J316_VARKO